MNGPRQQRAEMTGASGMTLYTFAASQSSEKIRWALDAVGLQYREHRLTPFLHYAGSLSIGGSQGVSLPTLEADGEMIQDSTRILEWLETNRAPFALIPRDPEERAAAMKVEAHYDHIAPHIVRVVYATLLESPELVRRLWALDASLGEAALMRVGYPLLHRVFRRGLGLTPALIEHSRRVVDRNLRELDRLAESGKVYQVGNHLSVADITAAARLAPLVCPDEHPVFSDPEYRDALAPLSCPWQARPGIGWVREMYRLHRRARPPHVIEAAPSSVAAFHAPHPLRRVGGRG